MEHVEQRRQEHFDPDAEAPRRARRWLVETLEDLEVEATPADLLLSELATNAVVHAGTPFTVEVHVNGVVRVEVADRDRAGTAAIRWRGLLAEGGRGLSLVDALSKEWGVTKTAGGKRVWFEL